MLGMKTVYLIVLGLIVIRKAVCNDSNQRFDQLETLFENLRTVTLSENENLKARVTELEKLVGEIKNTKCPLDDSNVVSDVGGNSILHVDGADELNNIAEYMDNKSEKANNSERKPLQKRTALNLFTVDDIFYKVHDKNVFLLFCY